MSSDVLYLQDRCREMRRDIFLMITNAVCGHFGGSLSCVEILASLYFKVMHIDPESPDWDERDRFINSKGHATAAYYAALAGRGYFEKESLLRSFARADSCFEEHGSIDVPGVDISTGSLGQGLSVGAGMALAAKLSGKNYRCYVLLGDGECQEGQVWEAAMFGSQYELDNLIAVVDRNRLQVMGEVEKVVGVEPLKRKWEAFGWETFSANGHDVRNLTGRLLDLKENGKPKVIVADTIKGKGVSFMENSPDWHAFSPLSAQELETAKKELGIS